MFSFLDQPSTDPSTAQTTDNSQSSAPTDDPFGWLPKIDIEVPKLDFEIPGVSGGGEIAPSAPPVGDTEIATSTSTTTATTKNDDSGGWGSWGIPNIELPIEMPKIELELPKVEIPGMEIPGMSSTPVSDEGQHQESNDLSALRGGGEGERINPRSPPSVERIEAQNSNPTTTPNSTENRPPPQSLEEIDLITLPPMSKAQEEALYQQFLVWYKTQAEEYRARTGDWPPNYDPQREFTSWRENFIRNKTIQYQNTLKQKFVMMKQQQGEPVDIQAYQQKQAQLQQQRQQQQQQPQQSQQQQQQQQQPQQSQQQQQPQQPQQPQQQQQSMHQQVGSQGELPSSPPSMGSEQISSLTVNSQQSPPLSPSALSSGPSGPMSTTSTASINNQSGDPIIPLEPPKTHQKKSVSFLGFGNSKATSDVHEPVSPPSSPNPSNSQNANLANSVIPTNITDYDDNNHNKTNNNNENHSVENQNSDHDALNISPSPKKPDAMAEEYRQFLGGKQQNNDSNKRPWSNSSTTSTGSGSNNNNPDAAFNNPNAQLINGPKKGDPNSPRTNRSNDVEAGTTPTTPGAILKPPPKNKNKGKGEENDNEEDASSPSGKSDGKSKWGWGGKKSSSKNTDSEQEGVEEGENEIEGGLGEDGEEGNSNSKSPKNNKSGSTSSASKSPRVRLKVSDIPQLTPNQARVLGEFKNMLINKGVKVRKLGSNGKMQTRTFTLDPRTNSIRWDTQKLIGSGSACIKLEDIEEIREGVEPTEVVLNSGADRKKCITFFMAGGKEIVVECVSDHFAKIFATCFSLMKQENDRRIAEAWEAKHPPGAGAFR